MLGPEALLLRGLQVLPGQALGLLPDPLRLPQPVEVQTAEDLRGVAFVGPLYRLVEPRDFLGGRTLLSFGPRAFLFAARLPQSPLRPRQGLGESLSIFLRRAVGELTDLPGLLASPVSVGDELLRDVSPKILQFILLGLCLTS
jgi:hypothetical protein